MCALKVKHTVTYLSKYAGRRGIVAQQTESRFRVRGASIQRWPGCNSTALRHLGTHAKSEKLGQSARRLGSFLSRIAAVDGTESLPLAVFVWIYSSLAD